MRKIYILILLMMVLASAQWAHAELRVKDGRWRLELGGFEAFRQGSFEDERYVTCSVEYEVPASSRATLGLRLYPLFFYRGDGAIWGSALGVAGRVYQHKETYDGFFGELGVAGLWHSREFEGNDSRVNFLSEAGLGYKIPETPWHFTLKLQHLSNGQLGDKNAGLNGLGLAAGYTF